MNQMVKISSAWTSFYKRVFPIMWFGFLAFFMFTALAGGVLRESPIFMLGPILMAVIGYFMMKNMVWILADEVYDCGEYLLFKNAGKEEMVYLSNVMNVSATTMMNPPHVTLRLIAPGTIGSEVTFSPAETFTLNPFAKNRIADDLMVRAHRARAGRAV